MPEIIEPGKTRFKVAVIEQRVTYLTVQAHDELDAVKQVQAGYGRHAGSDGPDVVAIRAGEIGTPNDPQTGGQKISEDLIIPGSV